jgi:hypothetical protein
MEKLFNQFEMFKNLSKSDFKIFKLYDPTKNKLKLSNKQLDEIILNSDRFGQPKDDQTTLILQKFYDEQERFQYFSTVSKVKKLIWVLDSKVKLFETSIIENGMLTTALELIDTKFSTSMYSGLIHVLFSNWLDPRIERLRKYVNKKLINETDKKPKIIFFQDNIEFILKQDGPERWANSTFKKGIFNLETFFSSNQYLDILRSTDYFKIFAISLYEKLIDNNSLNSRELWSQFIPYSLNNFEISITKYLISYEIFKFRSILKTHNYRDKIKNDAFKIIGDPAISANWLVESVFIDFERRKIIGQVRSILNSWVNETLVNLFFTKVVDDFDRRMFWRDYIDKMSTVDIFLNYYVLGELLNDERVKDGLENRFGLLNSGGITSSILIFTIGRFRFVLAGSTGGGALYVHPEGSGFYPNLEKLPYDSIITGKKVRSLNKQSIVHSSLPNLIDQDNNYLYFKNEGRMIHSGNWQHRLRAWMNNRL